MARGQGLVLSRIKITLHTDGQTNSTSTRSANPMNVDQEGKIRDTIKDFFDLWHDHVEIELFDIVNQNQDGSFDLEITVGLGNKKTGTQSSPASLASFLTQGQVAGTRTGQGTGGSISNGNLVHSGISVPWGPCVAGQNKLQDAQNKHKNFVFAINGIAGINKFADHEYALNSTDDYLEEIPNEMVFEIRNIQDVTNDMIIWANCMPFFVTTYKYGNEDPGDAGEFTDPYNPQVLYTPPASAPGSGDCPLPQPEASAEQRRLYPEPDPEYEP